jgi:hypothetical protein
MTAAAAADSAMQGSLHASRGWQYDVTQSQRLFRPCRVDLGLCNQCTSAVWRLQSSSKCSCCQWRDCSSYCMHWHCCMALAYLMSCQFRTVQTACCCCMRLMRPQLPWLQQSADCSSCSSCVLVCCCSWVELGACVCPTALLLLLFSFCIDQIVLEKQTQRSAICHSVARPNLDSSQLSSRDTLKAQSSSRHASNPS